MLGLELLLFDIKNYIFDAFAKIYLTEIYKNWKNSKFSIIFAKIPNFQIFKIYY
jgi:hypothetical protein